MAAKHVDISSLEKFETVEINGEEVILEEEKLTGIRWFFESNDTSARLLRTIVQGVLAAICAALTHYATNAPEWVSVVLIPILMAIFSPVMALIGNTLKKEEEPLQKAA